MGIRRKTTLLADEGEYGAAAERMVDRQLRARGIEHAGVLQQMRAVPRHLFLDAKQRTRAYEDSALPTMHGQTVSQPYIVALMTELLAPGPGDRVLEIGTGSGYQTAILARLARQVVSVERDGDLADHARAMLRELGVDNVTILTADGTAGAPEHGPFDRILVTAGAPTIPEPLKSQLADGGRLVIPVGDANIQQMTVVTRRGDRFEIETSIRCRFVPLVGQHGWKHGRSI